MNMEERVIIKNLLGPGPAVPPERIGTLIV
jgi:hypothetical protein